MAAPALDVFIVTFNCGKEVVDAEVLANHLHGTLRNDIEACSFEDGGPIPALKTRRGVLPELVVFSLQEIAPLMYGYLGGHFLSNYFNPFTEALNKAALKVKPDQAAPTDRPPLQRSPSTLPNLFRKQPGYPYKLIEARNVGMTAIMLFALRPDAIQQIEAAECAFGIANMGNKGAIALRVTYTKNRGEGENYQDRTTAEVTFVATHLAAMEYNLRRRNANWASICSSCLFEDPLKTLPEEYHALTPGPKNTVEASTRSSSTRADGKQTDGGEDIPSETEEETNALLERFENHNSMPENLTRHLHDISIFKRSSHLFVAGDLNYRISTTTPGASARFPNMKNWPEFLPQDQLIQEKDARRTLHGMTEATIAFPPTYKIRHLSHDKIADAVNRSDLEGGTALDHGGGRGLPWKYASHRWPGWCDRILYLDTPAWIQRSYSDTGTMDNAPEVPRVRVLEYASLPVMITSDHAPVYLRACVPLLSPEELKTQPDEVDLNDPRAKLPVPIDTGAFARRATARRREVFTGMTALFFSTKEGAIVVAAVAVVGFGTYWTLQNHGFL